LIGAIVQQTLLLSEFGAWARFLTVRHLSAWLAAGTLISTVPVAFTHWAGIDCIEAQIATPASVPVMTLLYGFVAELNHALAYFIVLTVGVALTISFVNRAGAALSYMCEQGDLFVTATGSAEEARHYISSLNRRWATPFTCLLLAGSVVGIAWLELPTMHNKAFGWVQGAAVPELNGIEADQLTTPTEILRRLSERWKQENPASSAVSDPGKFVISIVHPSLHTMSEYRSEIAICAALLVEVIVVFIALWTLFKIAFVCLFLSSCRWVLTGRDGTAVGLPLPPVWWSSLLRRWFGRSNYVPVLRLNVDDDEKRFGIQGLDAPFNLGAVLCLGVAVDFWLSFVSNSAKGTWFWASPSLTLTGQILLPVGMVTAVLAFVAVVLFRLHTFLSDQQMEFASKIVGDRARYKLVMAQRVWPGWRSGFTKSIVLAFCFVLVLPAGLDFLVSAIGGTDIVKGLQQGVASFPRSVCTLVWPPDLGH
jgi:hypothetical protein